MDLKLDGILFATETSVAIIQCSTITLKDLLLICYMSGTELSILLFMGQSKEFYFVDLITNDISERVSYPIAMNNLPKNF